MDDKPPGEPVIASLNTPEKASIRRWLDRWLAGGLVVLTVITGSAALNYLSLARQHELARWVQHTRDVLDALRTVQSHMRDAEAAQRTFLITGEALHLGGFSEAVSQARRQVAQLEQLTTDNPSQRSLIPDLTRDIDELESIWSQTAAARRDQGLPAAAEAVSGGQSLRAMETLTATLAAMRTTEEQLLAERSERADGAYTLALASGLGGGFVGIVAVGTLVALMRRRLADNERLAQEAARQAARVKLLIDQAPDAVFIADLGERFIEVNDGACALLGRPRAALLGKTIGELMRPEERPRLATLKATQLLGGHQQEEWELLHQDGSWVPVSVSSRILPGNLWVAFVRDCREQHKAQAALKFQSDLIRSITDNAATAIFMMDERSRCTFMNPAAEQMTGFSFDELKGGVLHDFIHHHHPDGRPYPVQDCPLDQALPHGHDVVRHEDVFIRKSGEQFPVEVNARVIRQNNVPVGTVIEVRDVSIERRALKGLAEAAQQKDRFIATLAHELRNPLAPIRAAAHVLRAGSISKERLSWAGEVIERQVGQMAGLLDDLLDVARITSGKLRLNLMPVSLDEVLKTAVEAAQPLIDRKGQHFTRRAPDDVRLLVDPLRLAQAVTNLLTNASKYTGPAGDIELTAEIDGVTLKLDVRDSGIGLEAQDLERIFTMFGQVQDGAHRSEGLGIGLALTKGLIDLHGGRIYATSAGKGFGSQFTIVLPDAVTQTTPVVTAPAPLAALTSHRILVIDDNRDAADGLALLLELPGHQVRVAYGGTEGLLAIETFEPDIVFVDIGMPDPDGYAVAKEVRARSSDPGHRGPVLVALTGWGQPADRERARNAGFDAHLTKPADPHALNELLSMPIDKIRGLVPPPPQRHQAPTPGHLAACRGPWLSAEPR